MKNANSSKTLVLYLYNNLHGIISKTTTITVYICHCPGCQKLFFLYFLKSSRQSLFQIKQTQFPYFKAFNSRSTWKPLCSPGGTQEEADSPLCNRAFENSLCSSTHTTLYSIAHTIRNHCTHYAGGVLLMFFQVVNSTTCGTASPHSISFARSYTTNCRGSSKCTVAFRTPCIIRSTINITSYRCIVFYISIMPPVR